VLREQTRESDICCRFGGEEFIVILPLTSDRTEALEIAERIRASAESTSHRGHRVTVSVGVASSDHETNTTHALIERADRAMYAAKRAGKNQVVQDVERPVGPMEMP
jgi:diguanylate cyclase (GGDEF)-like protein